MAPAVDGADASASQEVVNYNYVEVYSGPLPSPLALKQYRDIQPDFPERIITMAENRQKHSHEMERMIVSANIADKKMSRLMGFASFFVLIFASLIAHFAGLTGLKWIFGISGILGIVANAFFILSKQSAIISSGQELMKNEDE